MKETVMQGKPYAGNPHVRFDEGAGAPRHSGRSALLYKMADDSKPAAEKTAGRLMSLDALRGADMLFIMGFSGAVVALCQLLGFGKDCWLATQMSHVAWHGLRHHDTIFPLFIFLAGAAWPFSLASQQAHGRTTAQIVRKILLRVFMLWFLGLAARATFWAFDVKGLRYDTVLAHVGVCWGVAALLSVFVRSAWTRLAVAAALLVAHFLALKLFVAPDAASILASTDPAIAKRVASYATYGTDGFSFAGNIAGWIDRTVMPGHLTEIVFDADGLLAKLTGVAIAVFGTLAGTLLRRQDVSGGRKTAVLFGAGLAALVISLAWSPWCPVNKKLWTATFALAVSAYSFTALALFYWIIDVKRWRRWTFFFRVIGMNSIAIYMLMKFVGFGAMSKYFFSGVASLGNSHWAAMVYCLGQVVLEWLVLLFLYKKGTFLKV